MRIFSILFCFLLSFVGHAQSLNGWIVGGDFHYGKLLKHSAKQQFDVPNPCVGMSIDFMKQTDGSREWQMSHHFPRLGVGMLWKSYGNDSTLGNVTAIYPQYDVWLVRKERFRMYVRMAYGLGWINKIYDRNTNKLNTSIGTHVNNYTSLGIATEYNLTPQWTMRLGGDFSHSSNGHFSNPNLGLNTLTLHAGVSYNIGEFRVDTAYTYREVFLRKMKFGFRMGMGFKEGAGFEGPIYPVYILSPYVIFPVSKKHRWLVGFEFTRDAYTVEFNKWLEVKEKDSVAIVANRFLIYGGHEFMFGRTSFLTELQIFVDPPFQSRQFFATRLGPQFYLNRPSLNPKFNVFAGIFLKAQYAVAQYPELTLGVVF